MNGTLLSVSPFSLSAVCTGTMKVPSAEVSQHLILQLTESRDRPSLADTRFAADLLHIVDRADELKRSEIRKDGF